MTDKTPIFNLLSPIRNNWSTIFDHLDGFSLLKFGSTNRFFYCYMRSLECHEVWRRKCLEDNIILDGMSTLEPESLADTIDEQLFWNCEMSDYMSLWVANMIGSINTANNSFFGMEYHKLDPTHSEEESLELVDMKYRLFNSQFAFLADDFDIPFILKKFLSLQPHSITYDFDYCDDYHFDYMPHSYMEWFSPERILELWQSLCIEHQFIHPAWVPIGFARSDDLSDMHILLINCFKKKPKPGESFQTLFSYIAPLHFYKQRIKPGKLKNPEDDAMSFQEWLDDYEEGRIRGMREANEEYSSQEDSGSHHSDLSYDSQYSFSSDDEYSEDDDHENERIVTDDNMELVDDSDNDDDNNNGHDEEISLEVRTERIQTEVQNIINSLKLERTKLDNETTVIGGQQLCTDEAIVHQPLPEMHQFRTASNQLSNGRTEGEIGSLLFENDTIATPVMHELITSSIYSKVGVSSGIHTWNMRIIHSPDEFPAFYCGVAPTLNTDFDPECTRGPMEGIFFSTFIHGWTYYDFDSDPFLDVPHRPLRIGVNQVFSLTIDMNASTITLKIEGKQWGKSLPFPANFQLPLYLCIMFVYVGVVLEML